MTAARPRFVAAALAFALSFVLLWLWSSGIKDALVWGAFAYTLYDAARHRRKFWPAGLGLPLLAYLAACAVAAIFSMESARTSWHDAVRLLALIAGFLSLFHLLRPGRRSAFCITWVAAAFAMSALLDAGLLLINKLAHAGFLPDGRWIGSHFGFPTIAACVHAVGFVLCGAVLVRGGSLPARLLALAALPVFIVLLMHLQTRSVLLGIGAGLGVFTLATAMRNPRAWILAALCALALAGATAASPTFRARLSGGSLSDRNRIWPAAYHLIRMRPWTGFGYGHGIFWPAQQLLPRTEKLALRPYRYDHAHNMLLESAVEGGLPMLITWIWLLCAAILRFVRAVRRTTDGQTRWALSAVGGSLAMLVVYGQFSTFFALAPIFLFWCLLGLTMALCEPDQTAPES